MPNLFLLFVYPPRTHKNRDRYRKLKRPIAFPVILSREMPNIRFRSWFAQEMSAVCDAPKIAHNLRIQQPFNKHAVADVSLSSHGGTRPPGMAAVCYCCIYVYIRLHTTKRFRWTFSTLVSKSKCVVWIRAELLDGVNMSAPPMCFHDVDRISFTVCYWSALCLNVGC